MQLASKQWCGGGGFSGGGSLGDQQDFQGELEAIQFPGK